MERSKKLSSEISTKAFTKKLAYYFKFTKNLVGHNLHLKFEVDLLSITPAGYASAVEIKISKSDLKKDLKKAHWDKEYLAKYPATADKHRMEAGNPNGMFFGKYKHFYYAVPEHILKATVDQVPEWCGILVWDGKRIYQHREATAINSYKWSIEEKFKIARLMAIRNY